MKWKFFNKLGRDHKIFFTPWFNFGFLQIYGELVILKVSPALHQFFFPDSHLKKQLYCKINETKASSCFNGLGVCLLTPVVKIIMVDTWVTLVMIQFFNYNSKRSSWKLCNFCGKSVIMFPCKRLVAIATIYCSTVLSPRD